MNIQGKFAEAFRNGLRNAAEKYMYHQAIFEFVDEWAHREGASLSMSSNGGINCWRGQRSLQFRVEDDLVTVFNNRPIGPGKFQAKIELADPGSFDQLERLLVQNLGSRFTDGGDPAG